MPRSAPLTADAAERLDAEETSRRRRHAYVVSNSAYAKDLREAASAAVVQTTPPPLHRGAMPPGLKWTGIGLLIAGGVTAVLGTAVKNGNDCGVTVSSSDCETLGTGFYIFGGALAGTGAALLGVANAKRERLPSISVQRGRLAIAERIAF